MTFPPHTRAWAEWHPTRNTTRPTAVYGGSPRRFWWTCPAHGHEWQASLRDRIRHNHGCPFCAGKRVMLGFNDLSTLRPDLADEWSPRNQYKGRRGHTRFRQVPMVEMQNRTRVANSGKQPD
ncbi:hypothetical protein FXW78_50050 [Rhodococcus opacus]|nr:hypothetical protein [Rhodococcus opacus]